MWFITVYYKNSTKYNQYDVCCHAKQHCMANTNNETRWSQTNLDPFLQSAFSENISDIFCFLLVTEVMLLICSRKIQCYTFSHHSRPPSVFAILNFWYTYVQVNQCGNGVLVWWLSCHLRWAMLNLRDVMSTTTEMHGQWQIIPKHFDGIWYVDLIHWHNIDLKMISPATFAVKLHIKLNFLYVICCQVASPVAFSARQQFIDLMTLNNDLMV